MTPDTTPAWLPAPLPEGLPGPPEQSAHFSVLVPRILHRHQYDGYAGLVDRVAALWRAARPVGGPGENQTERRLRTLMHRGAFLPNSPLLVHAGESNRRLFACFSVGASPDLPAFLETARSVHDGMGGVGFSLPRGLDVSEARSFIAAVDRDTVAHQAGRPRPASSAVTVGTEEASFEAVLALAGQTRTTMLNAGLSDAFMARVASGNPVAQVRLDSIAQHVWSTGQPGVVFTDRIPRFAARSNSRFAANVCGEAPLAEDESGLLGSLNLVQFLRRTSTGWELDWEALGRATEVAVRFLDAMHDVHHHPTVALESNSLATRKIGVGIMGWAHTLALIGVRYGTTEACELACRVGRSLSRAALHTSATLADETAPYPAWSPEQGPRRRNACLVAIAGTATLSLLVGTTGGIEPMNGHLLRSRVMGTTSKHLDPIVRWFAQEQGIHPADVVRQLQEGTPLVDILGPRTAWLLPLAADIAPEEHIQTQAAFQREIDGGISKTIICAPDCTPHEMKQWIQDAYRQGCLGLTIYREGTHANPPFEPCRASKSETVSCAPSL